jgi:hypothetical protein
MFKASTMKSSESSAATKPPSVIKKKLHRQALESNGKAVESPSPSSDFEGSTERPAKSQAWLRQPL